MRFKAENGRLIARARRNLMRAVFFASIIFVLPCWKEKEKMGNQSSGVKLTLSDNDRWAFICASKAQEAGRNGPKPKPSFESVDEMLAFYKNRDQSAKDRESRKIESLRKGIVPEDVIFENLEGNTLWRRYQCDVDIMGTDDTVSVVVNITYTGYYGIDSTLLAKYGKSQPSVPELVARYIFDSDMNPKAVILFTGDTNLVVHAKGNAILPDWEKACFPSGCPVLSARNMRPSDGAPARACYQTTVASKTETKIWLSENEIDPQTLEHLPDTEYEVQIWEGESKWWRSAFVYSNGGVALYAKILPGD
jgi:hypothetical protein